MTKEPAAEEATRIVDMMRDRGVPATVAKIEHYGSVTEERIGSLQLLCFVLGTHGLGILAGGYTSSNCDYGRRLLFFERWP